MAQSNLLQLAQAGDAEAIATLMNASLQAIGVSARAVLRDGNLHVLLESERILAPTPSIEFIRRGLARLGLGWLSTAVVYSRLVGQRSPIWVEQVPLNTPNLVANPFVLNPELPLESVARERTVPILPRWKRVSPLTLLLLLSVPLLFVVSSGIIWFRFVVGTDSSPSVDATRSNAKTAVAKTLLFDAENPADPFNRAIAQGYAAYQTGNAATNRQAWRKAAAQWQQAIAQLQSVPRSHPKFTLAQQKIPEYQGHLDHIAKVKLSATGMEPVRTITGTISPKSVVHSGKGLFFAQNMMYNHTITVYDRQYNLVKTISDQIKLSDFGYSQYPGTQNGAPVEAAFSPDGNIAWVSNYQMYGAGFSSSADDDCSPTQNHDPSFLYRISTKNLNIERAIQVGAVPKYVATTPNSQYVLVSNWCSWDVSVIDPAQNKEIRRIQLGPYPRGIAIDHQSRTAYVAVMGSYDIATINLKDFSVNWIRGVGHSPRHLNIDPNGRYLYATLNGEGQIAKIKLPTNNVVSKVATGSAPRSTTISGDGQFLYVVNYDSDTVSKIRTFDMQVVQTVSVGAGPIGITYDDERDQVWVACYTGSIQVFQD
ncbi:YVTN family beta-propeller repeat protein [Leptolyngbyaceae cyanobacterium JSC-12]|nr:YVTN family beta-propeller repeat protein [Leptolyngbyaceae cyanobacterium JSC-12]